MRKPIANGIFLGPNHPLDEDPTRALERDLELIEHLDRLGYAEAWVGEHHSGGYAIISSPELFIAAASQRSRDIRLGTGVIPLPFHNPLMVANRMILLDHLTRGRVMFGVGPGLFPTDAHMLGIEVADLRPRMAAALDVILRLLDGEVVSDKQPWYELKDARCQLLPYAGRRPEVCVSATVTPTGGRLAGRYGLGLLCLVGSGLDGYDSLALNWQLARDGAAANGHEMPPERLRLVAPVHLAATRDEARRNVEYGIHDWLAWTRSFRPGGDEAEEDDPVQALIAEGRAVIGTPDDAIAQLERLWQATGGFGTFLQLAHNWADFDKTRRSYELFARYVTPHFDGANRARQASSAWMQETRKEMWDRYARAQTEAIARQVELPIDDTEDD